MRTCRRSHLRILPQVLRTASLQVLVALGQKRFTCLPSVTFKSLDDVVMNYARLLTFLLVSLFAVVACAAWWEKNETHTITTDEKVGKHCCVVHSTLAYRYALQLYHR